MDADDEAPGIDAPRMEFVIEFGGDGEERGLGAALFGGEQEEAGVAGADFIAEDVVGHGGVGAGLGKSLISMRA